MIDGEWVVGVDDAVFGVVLMRFVRRFLPPGGAEWATWARDLCRIPR